jgi:hypothetical protein
VIFGGNSGLHWGLLAASLDRDVPSALGGYVRSDLLIVVREPF